MHGARTGIGVCSDTLLRFSPAVTKLMPEFCTSPMRSTTPLTARRRPAAASFWNRLNLREELPALTTSTSPFEDIGSRPQWGAAVGWGGRC